MVQVALRHVARTLLLGSCLGVMLWLIWGQDLRYDVYYGGVFAYDEPFSDRGRTLISTFVGLVLAFGGNALCWLVSLRPKEDVVASQGGSGE